MVRLARITAIIIGSGTETARELSKDHVLLSVLAELRLMQGKPAELGALLEDLREPPISHIGALELDAFVPKTDRRSLAAALNTLLASPTFASWRKGATLDIEVWLSPREGRTPGVIVGVTYKADGALGLVSKQLPRGRHATRAGRALGLTVLAHCAVPHNRIQNQC